MPQIRSTAVLLLLRAEIRTGPELVLDRHGENLLRELERLVGIGMTPPQVLMAATVTSADAPARAELGPPAR